MFTHRYLTLEHDAVGTFTTTVPLIVCELCAKSPTLVAVVGVTVMAAVWNTAMFSVSEPDPVARRSASVSLNESTKLFSEPVTAAMFSTGDKFSTVIEKESVVSVLTIMASLADSVNAVMSTSERKRMRLWILLEN